MSRNSSHDAHRSISVFLPDLHVQTDIFGKTQFTPTTIDAVWPTVLGQGMVVRDEDSEVADAIWYSEFLKECGIVQYTAEFRNCGIHYLTDCEGHDLVCVDITLFNGKETLAISPLLFMSFGYGVKSDKPKLSLVKFN